MSEPKYQRRVGVHGNLDASLVVTVPKDLARKLQLSKGDYLRFRDENGHVCIRKGVKE